MKTNEYQNVLVESFMPANTSGHHGLVHIRPLLDQYPFEPNMFVQCSKKLSED